MSKTVTTAEAIAFWQAYQALHERKCALPALTAYRCKLAAEAVKPVVAAFEAARLEQAVAHGATDGQPVPDDKLAAFLDAINPLLTEAHPVTVKAVDPETAFGDAVLTPEEMGALCAVLAEGQ